MRGLPIVVAALLVGSCTCAVPVSVRGSLEEGVTFELREARNLQIASVSTVVRSGEWKTIWKISGKDRVGTLRYGEATDGLQIKVGPEGLTQGEVYSFHLETAPWNQLLDASCIGNVLFTVTSQGIVKECSTAGCPERRL